MLLAANPRPRGPHAQVGQQLAVLVEPWQRRGQELGADEDRIGAGQEGWLSFGQPGVPTQPPLAAEHFVKPEPGVLVLFPSYMWHGTAPFHGDGMRLTAAFDVLPG